MKAFLCLSTLTISYVVESLSFTLPCWRAASPSDCVPQWKKNRIKKIDITHDTNLGSLLYGNTSQNPHVSLSMAVRGFMNDYNDDPWSLDDRDQFYDSDTDDEESLDEFDVLNTIDEESNKNYDWTWETFQKHTHILLPPSIPSIHNNHTTAPDCILHFVGGTLFGSYPLQFYKPIMELVAKQTNSIVVASSIPLVFNDNPLNHFKISKRILNRFWNAYRYVLVDEYGHEAVNAMKIVGLGHSLGARLMMLMSKQSDFDTNETSKQRKRKVQTIDYNLCIFMSFNNYNALESIPGLAQLGQSIIENSYTEIERKREAIFQNKQQERRRRRLNRKYYQNKQGFYNYIRDEGNYDELNKKKSRSIRSDTNINKKYYTNDDDDDIGLNEVVAAVTDGITEGIQDMKTAVTPDLEPSDLEFQPTPQDLWDSIRSGEYVRNILLVQFDQDKIDQSSKLATIILEHEKNIERADNQEKLNILNETYEPNSKAASNTVQSTQNESNAPLVASNCLRFARLKGTHLTPVSYSDSFVFQALKRTGTMDQILEEAIKEDSEYRPRSKVKRNQVLNNDLEVLSKTIATYILDKV
jgi:hypothetical protein